VSISELVPESKSMELIGIRVSPGEPCALLKPRGKGGRAIKVTETILVRRIANMRREGKIEPDVSERALDQLREELEKRVGPRVRKAIRSPAQEVAWRRGSVKWPG